MHVVDVSSENYELQTDIADGVLSELNAVQKKIYVYNKIDNVETLPLYCKHPCCFVSAKTGAGIDELKDRIIESLSESIKRVKLVVPYDRGDIVSKLYAQANVISVEHEDTASVVTADIDKDSLYMYKDFITSDATPRR